MTPRNNICFVVHGSIALVSLCYIMYLHPSNDIVDYASLSCYSPCQCDIQSAVLTIGMKHELSHSKTTKNTLA